MCNSTGRNTCQREFNREEVKRKDGIGREMEKEKGEIKDCG